MKAVTNINSSLNEFSNSTKSWEAYFQKKRSVSLNLVDSTESKHGSPSPGWRPAVIEERGLAPVRAAAKAVIGGVFLGTPPTGIFVLITKSY